MSKKPIMLLLMLPMLTAGQCAGNTTETVRTVSDYCLISKPITYSEIHGTQKEDVANKYDTPETVKQVIDHDLTFEKVCVPKP